MVFVLVCAMCTADYFGSESDPFIPTHISLPLGQYSLGVNERSGGFEWWVPGATQSGAEYSLAFLTDTRAYP